MSGAVLGVFVGGASRRMHGRAKGLLAAPDTGEPLLARAVRVGRDAGLSVVLVGDAGPYHSLALGLTALADCPAGIGPLGGLCALLAFAHPHPALSLACDMPFVTAPLLRRLAETPSPAAVLAPRASPAAPYEPLLARYDAPRVLPALTAALDDGVRSFQALFARLEVAPFALAPDELNAITDWDTPTDLTR